MRNFYYLTPGFHTELHDEHCCCVMPAEMPHTAYSASLYELDIMGLQALYQSIMQENEDRFPDWLNQQESQHTVYATSEQNAMDEVLSHAVSNAMLVINRSAAFPAIEPIYDVLFDLVNNEDGYHSNDNHACECNDTNEQKQTVCRICHARFVATIINYHLGTRRFKRSEKCPVCHCANPSDAHLKQEYKNMGSAQFGVFKNNAVEAQNMVAALLLARGITHIPNVFGDIPIVVRSLNRS